MTNEENRDTVKRISLSMYSVYRALYFRTFLVYFVVILPFLVLLTLGYDINLNKTALSHSLLISIETLPRNAQIFNAGSIVDKTPAEVSISSNQPVTLDIKEDGYLPEKFTFLSTENSNSFANISNLALLPNKPTILSKIGNNEKLLVILNDTLVLTKDEGSYYLRSFGFGGFQDTPKQIINPDSANLDEKHFFDLGGAFWFPNSNTILMFQNDKWVLNDLKKLPFVINKVIKKGDLLLFRTKDNQLWSFNINTGLLRFVDTNITGLSISKSPDAVWILKGGNIYRLSNIVDNIIEIDLNNPYYTLDISNSLSDDVLFFEVKTVFQGVAIKHDSSIVYIPDFDKNQKNYITKTAKTIETSGSAIYWLDRNGNFYVNNLELKSEMFLAQLPIAEIQFQSINIFYYAPWSRFMLYLDDKVYTLWYDFGKLNSSMVKYNLNTFSNGNCMTGLVEKNQFCIENNNLVSYRNTSIW